MKKRIYWIKWKMYDAIMMLFIRTHRAIRAIDRKWSERKGPRTTWDDVWKRLDSMNRESARYASKLNKLSMKSDENWRKYIDLKYRR